MRKKDKQFLGTIQGTGAKVIDKDLRLAIKTWKEEVSKSGKLKTIFENRHFTKKSVKRRKTVESARYRQQFS